MDVVGDFVDSMVAVLERCSLMESSEKRESERNEDEGDG